MTKGERLLRVLVNRDPRREPKRGDIVGYFEGSDRPLTRRVTTVHRGPRVSASWVGYVSEKNVRTSCGLSAWRAWSAAAVVARSAP
jgi:hypothetical protein